MWSRYPLTYLCSMCIYILFWICFQTTALYDCLRNSFRWVTTQYSDWVVCWMTKEMWFNSQHGHQIVLYLNVSRPAWLTPSLPFSGYFRLKWQGYEACNSPPWNAKVKNDWSSICFHSVRMDNCSCTFTNLPNPLLNLQLLLTKRNPKWPHPNHPECTCES